MGLDLPSVEPQYRDARILDFDMESVAAGFADPAWVPQKITAISWSWIGDDRVYDQSPGTSASLYEKPHLRRAMISEFLEDFNRADIVTGHNLLKHDLGVLNAECMRLGLPVLRSVAVQDTMRLPKTKGLKKGLDNLAGLVEAFERKIAMDWQQWEDAYEVPGWPEVIRRCHSDVVMHKELRIQMIERGWMKPTTSWRP